MNRVFLVAIATAILAGCASNPGLSDPFPGSGGGYFGAPSHKDVQSGRSVLTPGKLDFAKVGITTKQDVVKALGQPAWWKTNKDETSAMGYDFVEPTSFMGMQKVVRASFKFDASLVLTELERPR